MATADIAAEAFDEIPVDERTSGVHVEVRGVPGYLREQQEACIIAQMIASGDGTGTATPGVPVVISGDGSAAADLFGRGSHAHRMVRAYRAGNRTTPLTVIAIEDNAAGTKAARTMTLAGTAAQAGTLPVYVGLDRVQVGVAVGETAAVLAAALISAINDSADLPVVAEATATPEEVKVTAKHKGEIGNDIKLHVALLGELGGEAVPTGLTVSGLGFLTGGTANPVQTAARAAIANRDYHYYILGGWSDTTTLDAWSAELEDMWSPGRDLWGRLGLTARRGSLSQLKTFGSARNDRFISCLGVSGSPGPVWEAAARYAAQVTRSLANHPARPLQTLVLKGERSAPADAELSGPERKDLLWHGLATARSTGSGGVQIDRAITLYQRNTANDNDDTWLDVTTPATVGRIVNEIKKLIHDRFIATRCILVNDDTPVGPGIPYATPKMIEATVIAHYDRLQRLGLAENIEAFKKLFKVGRDPSDATRVNMIYTPDIANPLITFAAKVQFALQWPADLLAA